MKLATSLSLHVYIYLCSKIGNFLSRSKKNPAMHVSTRDRMVLIYYIFQRKADFFHGFLLYFFLVTILKNLPPSYLIIRNIFFNAPIRWSTCTWKYKKANKPLLGRESILVVLIKIFWSCKKNKDIESLNSM